MKKIISAVLAFVSFGAMAHGLTPMRLEVPAGSAELTYRFTAYNGYDNRDRFVVQCFKGDFSNEVPCESSPGEIILNPKTGKQVKIRVQFSQGDGVYMVCTTEKPAEDDPKGFISRICARVGVGYSSDPKKADQKLK